MVETVLRDGGVKFAVRAEFGEGECPSEPDRRTLELLWEDGVEAGSVGLGTRGTGAPAGFLLDSGEASIGRQGVDRAEYEPESEGGFEGGSGLRGLLR